MWGYPVIIGVTTIADERELDPAACNRATVRAHTLSALLAVPDASLVGAAAAGSEHKLEYAHGFVGGTTESSAVTVLGALGCQ